MRGPADRSEGLVPAAVDQNGRNRLAEAEGVGGRPLGEALSRLVLALQDDVSYRSALSG